MRARSALEARERVKGETVDQAGAPELASPSAAEWTPPTWEDVVRDHSARVYRLAYRLTGNTHDAEDRRRQRIRFEGLGEETTSRLSGAEPTPAQVFDDRHFDGDVQAALKALPPEYRAAVILCDIEGLSYEEIAETLGIKLGTVRSRIHRGRAQLREALEHRRPRHLSPAATGPAALAPVGAGRPLPAGGQP
jgi:DNA-directed RNA polymerase specialized sigma24 family protein